MLTESDYASLFDSAVLTTDAGQLKELAYVCRVAMANSLLYQSVTNKTGVPWPVIAGIHFRESDQSFKKHLHNGDPLTARTIHMPKDRPATGQPPFLWVDSAVDALGDFWRPKDWSIAGCLEFVERYNGCGYQKHSVNTPYLWDFTNQYTSGLFVSDGSFNAALVESRPGVAAILKMLAAQGVSLVFTD